MASSGGVLRVDDQGLQASPGLRLRGDSDGLTTRLPTPAAAVIAQATSVAAATANTAVIAAAAVAGRVRATGTKAALAPTRLEITGHGSARRIAALGNTVVRDVAVPAPGASVLPALFGTRMWAVLAQVESVG
jgi:hypothetical protein